MCGDESEGIHGVEYLDDGLHQGFALYGVGGARRLVDEYKQFVLAAIGEYVAYLDNLRGVAREAVHLVLVVAYGGGHSFDQPHLGLFGRHVHAALGHYLRATDAFEQYGLARHVGAGDEADAGLQRDVDGLVAQAHAFVALFQAWVDEPLVCYAVAYRRTCKVPTYGQLGFRQQEVGVSQLLQCCREGVVPSYQLVGEMAAHFGLYLVLHGQQFAYACGVAVRGLQGVQLAAQRCQTQVVAVVDVEVGDARAVGVKQVEHLVGAWQMYHLRQSKPFDGAHGRAAQLCKVLHLEELHLVERGV